MDKKTKQGKIIFIYHQLSRTWRVRNKGKFLKKQLPPTHTLSHKLNFTPLFPAPQPPLKERHKGVENGACGQSITAPLCCSFLLTLHPCSSMVSPRAEDYLLWCLEHCLPLLHHWLCCSQGCFSPFCFSSLLCLSFLLFLKYVFSEAPHTWVSGSSVLSGGSFGDSWNLLCPVLTSSQQRPSMQPPTANTLPWPSLEPIVSQDISITSTQYDIQGMKPATFFCTLYHFFVEAGS